jgi:hypothetical protein
MDFGDKIDELPVDEQTPPSQDIKMLMQVFAPEEPSKFSDMTYNLKLGAIAVILFIVLHQPPIFNLVQQYTKNTNTSKIVVFAIIVIVLYIYHTYF